MGFYANLLIVQKQKRLKSYHTVWEIDGVLSLGRVTGVEKLIMPRFQHLTWQGKQRAAVCIADELLNRLTRIFRSPEKSMFAPLFVNEELEIMETPPGRVLEQRHPKVREWVVPIEKSLFTKENDVIRLPKAQILARHNKVLTMRRERFAAYIEGSKYSVVEDTPLPWESCGEVALWIRDMEKSDGPVGKELSKDPAAISYAKAWRTYLEEMGKIGGRVIFFFDRLEIPSFL